MKRINAEEALALLGILGWIGVDLTINKDNFSLSATKNGKQLVIYGQYGERIVRLEFHKIEIQGDAMLRIQCNTGNFYIGANSTAFYGGGISHCIV